MAAEPSGKHHIDGDLIRKSNLLYTCISLDDRTAACSRIAHWHDTVVCLSVCELVVSSITVLAARDFLKPLYPGH